MHNTDINHMNITTFGRYHNQFSSHFSVMKNEKLQNNWNNTDQPLNIYERVTFEPSMNSERTRQKQQPSLNDLIPHNQIIKYNDKTKILKVPRPIQCKNENPILFLLQQHKITKTQLTIFCNTTQIQRTAELFQMTMNPYFMDGSTITSNKPLTVFTGTDTETSVEYYFIAFTANLVSNIGPEPVNKPLHQNRIYRRTSLFHTTLDRAAQKWFSVQP